jgi:hypothetical protein
MPYSEAVRPTRLSRDLADGRPLQAGHGAHSAISPRFAMRTDVSGLRAGGLVELWRTGLAARAR